MMPPGVPGQSVQAQYLHDDMLNALFVDGSVRRMSMDAGAAINSLTVNRLNFE